MQNRIRHNIITTPEDKIHGKYRINISYSISFHMKYLYNFPSLISLDYFEKEKFKIDFIINLSVDHFNFEIGEGIYFNVEDSNIFISGNNFHDLKQFAIEAGKLWEIEDKLNIHESGLYI